MLQNRTRGNEGMLPFLHLVEGGEGDTRSSSSPDCQQAFSKCDDQQTTSASVSLGIAQRIAAFLNVNDLLAYMSWEEAMKGCSQVRRHKGCQRGTSYLLGHRSKKALGNKRRCPPASITAFPHTCCHVGICVCILIQTAALLKGGVEALLERLSLLRLIEWGLGTLSKVFHVSIRCCPTSR